MLKPRASASYSTSGVIAKAKAALVAKALARARNASVVSYSPFVAASFLKMVMKFCPVKPGGSLLASGSKTTARLRRGPLSDSASVADMMSTRPTTSRRIARESGRVHITNWRRNSGRGRGHDALRLGLSLLRRQDPGFLLRTDRLW